MFHIRFRFSVLLLQHTDTFSTSSTASPVPIYTLKVGLLYQQQFPVKMVFIFEWLHSQLMVTPPKPSASFAGKTIIVTGSNTGLGKEACRWIVQLGASKIIIACRNIEKGKAAAKDIQSTTSCSANVLEVWELDLSSYPSVKAFADRAKSELARLDALLLNAGVTVRTFRIFNGNEETINTNVISCALLAFLLYPKLRETATRFNTQPHLSVTVSEMHELAKFKERNAPPGQLFAALAEEKNFNANDRYMTSKLLEILFVKQMAVVCPLKNNVIINAINPG